MKKGNRNLLERNFNIRAVVEIRDCDGNIWSTYFMKNSLGKETNIGEGKEK